MYRILVFGTGKYYEQRKEYLKNVKIIAFVDNDINKQGKLLDGIKIISPKEIEMYSFDYILLLSLYQYDMKKQLQSLNINTDKILEHTEIGKLIVNNLEIKKQYNFYLNCSIVGKKKALLMTHNMNNSGAQRALGEIGKILIKNNYIVYVISPVRGELEEFYHALGLYVLIEPALTLENEEFLIWYKTMEFNVCFINTIILHYLISEFQKIGPTIIWWIHETNESPQAQFEGYLIEKTTNLKICVVGLLAKTTIREKFQIKDAIELLYGVDERFSCCDSANKKEKLVFAIIGYIHPLKAQDIFIKAINILSDSAKDMAEFYVVGRINNIELYKEVLAATLLNKNIKIIGELNPSDMMEFYNSIDIVVCPSRYDTMPMVVTEGLMKHKVCIVSDNTGFVDYIIDKKNGLLCEARSVESLKNKMEWIINNQHCIKEIGDNGRKVYDEHFSIKVFEKNIINLLT